MNNDTDTNDNLVNEILLDLVIALKMNKELINENSELRKKMGENTNDINK